MLGRLTTEALKHDPIEYGAGISMALGALSLIAVLTYYKKWGWLWKEWLTSLDHKKIGIMYIVLSLLMLFKGFIDAMMMRAQQVMAVGGSPGYLEPAHYQQIFSAHGTTMIFFVAMGLVFGLINILLPLQIGARDVAYPFLNSVSFYLFAASALYINLSLVLGSFSGAGWLAYPPLSGLEYSPDEGVDYWIWTLQISGAGTLLSGINFLVTILKMRAPGMSWMRMPLFTWSVFTAVILVCISFPILTATIGMLSLDRTIGTHFFTSSNDGNPMMFINLIWAWGHPEVYILILPAFGIFSEVVPTFSQKKLFGYTSMIWALLAITVLSFIVWLHHFFTMGAGANVNAFFGIMTMVIAVPTGVKVFNWLFTCARGRIDLKTPMLWFLSFILLFSVGGAAGVLLSVPPVDFQLHNSLFLVAHFHTMVLPGVLFAFFAGATYWFPKVVGFKLNERLGRYAVVLWTLGFTLAFTPLYLLGFMGATRRLNRYDNPTWQPLFIIAAIGVAVIALALAVQFLQVWVSVRDRAKNRDLTGDPWNGRTLEWSIASPPPFYNFAHIPKVLSRDAFWYMKENNAAAKQKPYEPIHMPKDTSIGLWIGFFSFLFGFGMIWYIYWLAIISFIAIMALLILRLTNDDTDYYVPAALVEQIESEFIKRKRQA